MGDQEENIENNVPLVSIITPIYNCEKYIEQTLQSVLRQTYQNWELILVDDISSDKTLKIVHFYVEMDSRIKLLQLNKKGGASIARNVAMNEAKGRYIAFLDGDDLWLPKKLQKQVSFMLKNGYEFTYTNYYVTDGEFIYGVDKETSLPVKRCPNKVTYGDLLKRNRIGCLTVIFDAEKVGKVNIERLDKRNDYALWLKILREGFTGNLLEEPLAVYRSHQGLSKGSKMGLLKYHYRVFAEVLGYGKMTALGLTIRNLFFYVWNKGSIRKRKGI